MNKEEFLKLVAASGNSDLKLIATIEAYLGKKLPAELADYFLIQKYIEFDEFRPTKMAHWDESMFFPLNLDPNHALEIINNRFVWDEHDQEFANKLPFATFLEDDCKTDAGMDDFIAVSIDQNPCPVWLWDHEGYFTKIAASITEFLQSLKGKEKFIKSNYSEICRNLLSQADLKSALVKHFSFISKRDDFQMLINRVFEKVIGANIDQEQNLVISFADGQKLICSAAADGVSSNVPPSYVSLVARHNVIALSQLYDVPITLMGVQENGSLWDLDAAFIDSFADAYDNIDLDQIKCAIIDGQNQVAFRMDEKNEHNEPQMYYIDHEGGSPQPVWESLTFAEAFFVLVAEKILDEKLFEKYEIISEPIIIGEKSYKSNATEIYIDFKEVDSLPAEIKNLKKLKKLTILTTGKLKTLPPEIGFLKNLEELTINSKFLEELPEEIGELTKLKHIQLFKSKLKSLPPTIGKLCNLEELHLECELETLPDQIENLKNLETLWITSPALASLPESISELTKLKKIFLKGGLFESLPESIGKLEAMEEFTVVFANNLKSLPKSISNWKQLRQLTLNSCTSLHQIPDTFDSLKSLRDLNAQGTAIDNQAFANLCALGFIEELNLAKTKITKIPKEIGNLKALKTLKLSDNSITEIAAEISFCENLKNLYIGEACLKSFPIGLLKLEKLESLDLVSDGNGFEFPDAIAQMKVKLISFDNFPFETVPDLIFKMPLQRLSIANCPKLKSLPANLSSAKHLMKLWISNCPSFQEMPDSIKDCQNLYQIHLHDTAANEATLSTLCKTPGLVDLKIEGHHIAAISDEINERGIGKIIMEDGIIERENSASEFMIHDLLNTKNDEDDFDDKNRLLNLIAQLDNPTLTLRHHLALMIDSVIAIYGKKLSQNTNETSYYMKEAQEFLNNYLTVASRLNLPWNLWQGIISNLIFLHSYKKLSDTEFNEILSLIKEKIETPLLAFNLACYYAVTNDKTNALNYIAQALKLGKTEESFMKDTDFQSLWEDADFIKLINRK